MQSSGPGAHQSIHSSSPMMSPFNITTTDPATFSLALPENARQLLAVYATFKIPKTGPQLPIFDIMHSGALEKKQCKMVQGAKMSIEPVAPYFLRSRAKAKSLCTIHTDLILTLKSGMIYFSCFKFVTYCYSAPTLLNGLPRTTDQLILLMTEHCITYLQQDDHALNSLGTSLFPRISWRALISLAAASPSFYVYDFCFTLF